MKEIINLTQEGYDRLKNELEYLRDVKLKEISERIQEAKDFAEDFGNLEYEEAKSEQAMVLARINELEAQLSNARIIDKDKIEISRVGIGCKVIVKDLNKKIIKEYTILEPIEADPVNGKISFQSPVGKALFGKQVGDEVTVHTPGGQTIKLKVVSIERA
ncbi:MAG TPA: transcription elongation factor GreA [Thermodesulfobium narugense]|uniref:Transcription elongation factor GreA n=1 Tax=Thermodesulfobium acidiphilum TaxID=1794699 RepID=A0A2R4VZW8_THEAF|nr:transcription elongation factor GreA [Thermodesulfobium acidiphilum]AWB10089.1 transcription elongation factor GreA [Thermodesulfobium acidiphilum]PMP85988.1 MAG: transcription elongation factor GreA [Thermodesulfobium narugense]HEM56195.1 transcription elongation factor GreA [Thermodesulfobium narugense]